MAVSSPDHVTWHKCLGHASLAHLKLALNLCTGMIDLAGPALKDCKPCLSEKMKRRSNPAAASRHATNYLGTTSMDLFGPTHTVAMGGLNYFMGIIDDKTWWGEVAAIRKRSEALGLIKQWKVARELESGNKVKII